MTDRLTDQLADQRTDRRTDPVIEQNVELNEGKVEVYRYRFENIMIEDIPNIIQGVH